jgi:hypothetical protein
VLASRFIARWFRPASCLLALVVAALAGAGAPAARAACSGATCQGEHTASPDRGVSNGCCIIGNGVSNGEPVNWNLQTCYSGGFYQGQYTWKDWTETLASPSHHADCRPTLGQMSGQSCFPCGFAPFQNG